MLLRAVRVTIGPGQYDAYWAWAREIIRLWDDAGIRRAGGPYALGGASGEHVALWLTVHPDEDEARSTFRELYATGRGRELIEQRPALVSASETLIFPEWSMTGPPPAAPAW